MKPPIDPSDPVVLLRRRRHVVRWLSFGLLVALVVGAILSPSDSSTYNVATNIAGMSVLLLVVTGVISVQYTIRIRRLRKRGAIGAAGREQLGQGGFGHPGEGAAAYAPAVPSSSRAYRPLEQLRSAHQLLESALPLIEPVQPGVESAAEHTRLSLEQTAQRVVLQENVLGAIGPGRGDAVHQTGRPPRALADDIDRLESGVDRYTRFAQRASEVAAGIDGLQDSDSLQDATDALAGFAQGLKEVQQSSDHGLRPLKTGPGESGDR